MTSTVDPTTAPTFTELGADPQIAEALAADGITNAFPIQQLLAASGVSLPLWNMTLALPMTLACAVLSWHLIEAPALRWKSPGRYRDTEIAPRRSSLRC